MRFGDIPSNQSINRIYQNYYDEPPKRLKFMIVSIGQQNSPIHLNKPLWSEYKKTETEVRSEAGAEAKSKPGAESEAWWCGPINPSTQASPGAGQGGA